jgi:ParB family chromosome partitioning protein
MLRGRCILVRSSGLGKGLSSIIPTADLGETDTSLGAVLSEIPVASVAPNPNQPRRHFDEESLTELSASIAEMGVLQPILVRPLTEGRFELIAGERRWRAAERAGLATIPAVIRLTDDATSVEQALVENLHRQDLTALEEAAAFQQLLDEFGLTHDQIATRVGKSRSAITNSLRLLGLPPAVQHLLADGQLSAGHARALLGTPDRARQEQLAREAAAGGWSVRMVEEAVRADLPRATDPVHDTVDDPAHDHGVAAPVDGAGLTPSTRLRPPGLLELEHVLAEYLETRVSVQMSAKKGRVTIEFADLEDLERIYRAMTG